MFLFNLFLLTLFLQEGSIDLPQKAVIEKQSAIIDELREKLDMKLDDFDKLSTDELRTMVDSAIGRVSTSWPQFCPMKYKCSMCISDYMQTTFFYLGRFLKK